jgi:hypothetical protein
VYGVSRRRQGEKERRRASRQVRTRSAGSFELAERVERLAYTRKQAAEALGVSLTTLDRRVVPVIATVRTEWGTRLIPVEELERFLAERAQEARVVRGQPARRGRKPGLAPEVVARVRDEHSEGKSLGEIARGLDADGVKTSQGGRRWWPSTVRAVLIRSDPRETARASAASA